MMSTEQTTRKIAALAENLSNTSATAFAMAAGMKFHSSPVNPVGGYQWYGYSWAPFVSEVNMLEEPGGLKRIEFILARAEELEQSQVAEWMNVMEKELGKPSFQGSFRHSGFPEDEDGLEASVWHVGQVQWILLNRKEDAETPQELVVVLKP
jgi:hypothetical protein